MDIASGLKQDIVHELSLMLHQENQYVQNLQTAQELLRDNDSNQALKVVIYEEKRPRTEHARRFNRPVSDEIGILMPNAPTNNRDIVLHYRNGHLDQVSELHRAYDALQYPLLFPYGTDGYHIYLRRSSGKKVSQMDYYSFHIMIRPNNYLLQARRLFGAPKAPLYCFQKYVFVWLHVCIYIYIYVYICQDGDAVGFVDFTKLLFALSSLAQPFNQIRSIPEHVFVILSQRKAYARRFRKETAVKRTGPMTKRPPRWVLFTRLEIVFVKVSSFTKRTKVVPKVFQG